MDFRLGCEAGFGQKRNPRILFGGTHKQIERTFVATTVTARVEVLRPMDYESDS